jgi:hypothetical protein
MISKSLNKLPKICKIERGIGKKIPKDFTTTSTLPFKQQQNIAQSHFSPFITVLGKKVGQLKIAAAKLPVNEI